MNVRGRGDKNVFYIINYCIFDNLVRLYSNCIQFYKTR